MPQDQPNPTTADTISDAAQPSGAMFHCASCGQEMSLPEQLLGRQAKCPKCGLLGVIGRPSLPGREPDERDVRLDDLVADAPLAAPDGTLSASRSSSTANSSVDPAALALTSPSSDQDFRGHLHTFFQGNPLLNIFAGLLGGVHLCLVCSALALLFFVLPQTHGMFPHALWVMLLPAIFATMLFALHGRLTVALGLPEPAGVAAVLLLVAAVGGDMLGHASSAIIRSTLLAAVVLAALVSGVVSVVFARLGVPERVRFLPPEVIGGLLAGFGMLLVELWAMHIAQGNPALANLFTDPLHTNLAEALMSSVWVWAPSLAFGLLCFCLQLATHNFLWTILAAACATGVWHAAQLYVFPSAGFFTGPFGALPGLPLSLEGSQLLALADPVNLASIDWAFLRGRLDFFVAVAVLAFVPSMVRCSLLEVRQGRDVPPAEQADVLGASHMLSGALGGLPASLSLSASLGMRSLGAAGPLAGFTAALVCLGFALFGQPVVAGLPLFVPQGLLLSLALVMPVSWLLRDAKNSLSNTSDTRIAWTCCLGTVLLGPVLGVLGSLLLGLSVSLRRAVIDGGVRFVQTGDVYHSNVDRSPAERRALRELGGHILVLRLRGYLFLGTLFGLLALLRKREGLRYALLDFSAVSGLGSSAATGFRRLEQYARERGVVLFFTSLPLEVEEHFEALGYHMGEEGQCRIALNLDYALEWCEDQLLREAGALEDRSDSLEEMLAATFPEPRLVPILLQCLERVEVPRKKPVFYQGDDSDSMYFLQSGKVHVELSLPGGKIIRLKKMGPGTVFGEMGLYTSTPRSASVVAMEKCVLYRLSVERFKRIQTKAPQLASAVNRYIVALLAERVAEENAKTRASQL